MKSMQIPRSKFRRKSSNRTKVAFIAFFGALVAGVALFNLFLYLITRDIAPDHALWVANNAEKELVIENDMIHEVVKRDKNVVGSASDAHDLESIKIKNYYWKTGFDVDKSLHKLPTGLANTKYILFETDCGGFNNIRMAFEYFYLMAFLTQRTLVLPPPSPWYLIDFGPFARMKPEDKHKYLTTDYHEFFDLNALKAGVPVITFEKFRLVEGERYDLPKDLQTVEFTSRANRDLFKHWLRTESKHLKHLLWAPLKYVLYFPSIKEVQDKFPKIPKEFVHHREIVELTAELNSYQLLVFPSCKNNDDARYLGQVAAFAAFADEAISRSYKRLLRDHVHYKRVVFDYASSIVAELGQFEYISLHVRRNELQYKEVFMSSESLYTNIKNVLSGGEVFYIATDEKDKRFFDYIQSKGHQVFTWNNFDKVHKKWSKGNGAVGLRKLEGCVEQVICANGKLFFGTLESTFSSYIFRLRGYLNAYSTEVYFHTLKYTGNVEKDRKITYSKKPPKGQIYKSEHPSIWEDAINDKTFW